MSSRSVPTRNLDDLRLPRSLVGTLRDDTLLPFENLCVIASELRCYLIQSASLRLADAFAGFEERLGEDDRLAFIIQNRVG